MNISFGIYIRATYARINRASIPRAQYVSITGIGKENITVSIYRSGIMLIIVMLIMFIAYKIDIFQHLFKIVITTFEW